MTNPKPELFSALTALLTLSLLISEDFWVFLSFLSDRRAIVPSGRCAENAAIAGGNQDKRHKSSPISKQKVNKAQQQPKGIKTLVALHRAIRLRFGYGFESCVANGPRNVKNTLGSVFGRTDFTLIFIFGPLDFFRGFCRLIFSTHFCGKKCPEKSSRKIPGKILQNFHNKNPRHTSAEGLGQQSPFFPPLLPVGSQASVLKLPKRGQFHAATRVTTTRW